MNLVFYFKWIFGLFWLQNNLAGKSGCGLGWFFGRRFHLKCWFSRMLCVFRFVLKHLCLDSLLPYCLMVLLYAVWKLWCLKTKQQRNCFCIFWVWVLFGTVCEFFLFLFETKMEKERAMVEVDFFWAGCHLWRENVIFGFRWNDCTEISFHFKCFDCELWNA